MNPQTKKETEKSPKGDCCGSDCPKTSVFFMGLFVLIVGFAIGYFAYGYLAPKEAVVTETFTPDAAEVAKIKTLMEKIIYLNSGEKQDVTIKEIAPKEVLRFVLDLNGQETVIYFSRNYSEVLAPESVQSIEDLSAQIDAILAQMGETVNETGGQEVIGKTETPKVELYVMSYCPYGNEAENAINAAVLLLSDNIDFEPVYIIGNSGGSFSSLHGQAELNQDIREKIIYNLYGEKGWMNYVYKTNSACTLSNIETCWKTPATELGFNITKIEEEYSAKYNEIATAEALKTTQNKVTGSPTLLINGNKYAGQRNAESYKTGICAYFTQIPSNCTTLLNSTSLAAAGNC